MDSSLRLNRFILGLFFVSQIAGLGCQKWLQGKPSPTVLKFETQDLGCLSQFPQQMRLYLGDGLGPADINLMSDCASGALQEFGRWTQGQSPGSYSAQELQYFLNRYLLKENQIGDGMISAVMKLKVLFFGGSELEVSRAELKSAVEFIEQLRAQGHRLAGSWSILLMNKEKQSPTQQQLWDLESKVNQELQSFFLGSQLAAGQYSWENLQEFLFEFDRFLGGKKELQVLQEWLPLAGALKVAFMGDPKKSIGFPDWSKHVQWATRSYFLMLQYHYLISSLSFDQPDQAMVILDYIKNLMDQMAGSPQMMSFHFIDLEHINALIDQIAKMNLWKLSVTPAIFKESLRMAIWSFLGGRFEPEASALQNIRSGHLQILRLEFDIWSQSLRAAKDLFLPSQASLSKKIPPVNFSEVLSELKQKTKNEDWLTPESRSLGRAEEEWIQILDSKYAPVWSLGQLRIQKDKSAAPMTFSDFARMASYRSFARLILRGYGDRSTKNVWGQKLSLNAMVDLELDFRPFGRAIGLTDSRSLKAAERTFFEGNNFPVTGNGDELLSSSELLEMMHMLSAGGGTLAPRLISETSRIPGCSGGEDLEFKKPLVLRSCMQTYLRHNYPQFFKGLPGLVQEMTSWSDQDWSQLFDFLFRIYSLPSETVPKFYEYGEARTSMTLFYYVESLMQFFDQDGDGNLGDAELEQGAIRFRPLLEPMAGEYWKDVFVLLVRTGQPPGKWDVLWKRAKDFLSAQVAGQNTSVEKQKKPNVTGVPGAGPGTKSHLQIFRTIYLLKVLSAAK